MTRIRLAAPGDEQRLQAFLTAHLDSSMFLLGNLEAQGLGFGPHPHATRYALLQTGAGVTGVLGATRGGYLMCQLPGTAILSAGALLAALGPQIMHGMTGDAAQVAHVLRQIGLREYALSLNRVEPLMTLDTLPPPSDGLTPAGQTDRALLTDWLAQYAVETGQCSPNQAAARSQDLADRALAAGETRLLPGPDGQPLAMAAINARAGDAVQVGGVYVPPALRGQGLAARVVAALLAEQRTIGARRAVLFAASPMAQRAYLKLGFQMVGDYRVALLHSPLTLNATAHSPVPA